MKNARYLPLLFLCFLFLSRASVGLTQPVETEKITRWRVLGAPNRGLIADHPAFSTLKPFKSYYVCLAETAGLPDATSRQNAAAQGIGFLMYIKNNIYIIAAPDSLPVAALERLQIRRIAAIQPEWKCAPSLFERPFPDWSLKDDSLDVHIQIYAFLNIKEGANLCRQAGIRVLREGNQNGFLQARIPVNAVSDVAALPWVAYMELKSPPALPDDMPSRVAARANRLQSLYPGGPQYDGAGVGVLVRDDGPVGPHLDFLGRLYNQPSIAEATEGEHGDGVSGVLAGAGNLDPLRQGIAPGADLYTIDYDETFQDAGLALHTEKGVVVTNTSYSQGCNSGYSLSAQTVDKQLFENPFLQHVFSAGNNNGVNCQYGAGSQWGNITGGHKMAKNALVVGNLTPEGTLAVSSSRGPATDGRLKPDLSAVGNGQVSTGAEHTYQAFGGTSAAAPVVAGVIAQLTQAYRERFGGQNPPAVLLKAALLNTATDAGQPGPDFKFGWGQTHAENAWHLLENQRFVGGTVAHQQTQIFNIPIPSGVSQARFMICWADPPAAALAKKALVNDLDLSVAGPSGAPYLPWKPNPTPNTSSLDKPATTGRDSLNNVEQALVEQPSPGVYTVRVKGWEIPFGPQSFFLVWQFDADRLRITYPAGGEGFAPGETERIQWDASPGTEAFVLRYSTDDGAQWQTLTTLPGNLRYYDWQIPDEISGRCRLMLLRGQQTDVSAVPFSIAPLPTALKIDKVCPDSITVSWAPLAGPLEVEAYLPLGQKMEIAGRSDTSFFTFPWKKPGTPLWFSARAVGPGGLAGRRTTAIAIPPRLVNCPQSYDLALSDLLQPAGGAVIQCAPTQRPVQVVVRNEGLKTASGASLFYQLNDAAPVSMPLPDLASGGVLEAVFPQPIVFQENISANLKVWVSLEADQALFNDTLYSQFTVAVQPEDGFFTEGFDQTAALPPGWDIGNPDGLTKWTRSSGLTGTDGQLTSAYFMYCYNYNAIGQQDYLYLPPLDLSGLEHPALVFDVAYAAFLNANEILRVEAFPACNLQAQPALLWEKSGPQLATAPLTDVSFIPRKKEHWRREIVPLVKWADQPLVLRFTSVNDYGNNIYLDNIGIISYEAKVPKAQIAVSKDTVCFNDTLTVKGVAPEPGVAYTWRFGLGAQPALAEGPGPHVVRYGSAGPKSVQLIALNQWGADTARQTLQVQLAPVVDFTINGSGPTLTFQNNSLHASAFLWDFGDGSFSTETSPSHTYAASGTYTIRLKASNGCKTLEKSAQVVLLVDANAVSLPEGRVWVWPNPVSGDIPVQIDRARDAGEISLRLSDAQGRTIQKGKTFAGQGKTTFWFKNEGLPGGVYYIEIVAGRQTGVLRVILSD